MILILLISAIATENDYEGGVWIAGQSNSPAPKPSFASASTSAGEFYAEGPKHKKRKQSKESQIYGIWSLPPPPPIPHTSLLADTVPSLFFDTGLTNRMTMGNIYALPLPSPCPPPAHSRAFFSDSVGEEGRARVARGGECLQATPRRL
jgi:hypothetical protein